MKDRLTKTQQELVEKNHDLIYVFANKKNLVIDEYYDILAIGLCKAAKGFNEAKGKFSTFAFQCMKNEVGKFWTNSTIKRRVPENMILSYDAPKNHGSFLDFFADNRSAHDIVEDNIIFENLINLLTNKESIIVYFLLEGMTQSEIAVQMNCTQQNIAHFIRQIRKKWKKYLLTT